MGIKFTGDPKKAERNLPKHKLSFKTGEQVFGDPFVLIVEDCIDPITGEQRYNAIGRAPSQALLVVSFELPQDRNSALKPSCSKCLSFVSTSVSPSRRIVCIEMQSVRL